MTCFATLKNYHELLERVKNDRNFNDVMVVKCENEEADTLQFVEHPTEEPFSIVDVKMEVAVANEQLNELLEASNSMKINSAMSAMMQLHELTQNSRKFKKVKKSPKLKKTTRTKALRESRKAFSGIIDTFSCPRSLLTPIFDFEEQEFYSGRFESIIRGWRAFYDALVKDHPGLSSNSKWWTKNSRVGLSKVKLLL